MAATGGAAAVKTPFVLRRLREAGHEVRAAASEDAYAFVTKPSLALAAGSQVLDRELWFSPHGRALHLDWASWADLLLVAPATADAIAKGAAGFASDVVSALVVAGTRKVAWAPAMNPEMWSHQAVQANVRRLESYGHSILGPARGAMAALGEESGVGRMLEPDELSALALALFAQRDLEGRRLLVSAGPTREYLDPVRFLSNPSSGRMGYAVAAAALARGASVTLVSGPTSLTAPPGARLQSVTSAQEMFEALRESFVDCDALVMTAAVADWRAESVAPQKEPKVGERQTLELVRTPDILESLADQRGTRVLVGFAMETEEGVERAAAKARRKNLDFICLNYPTRDGSSFGGDQNQVTLVQPDGRAESLARMSKLELSHEILGRVARLLERRSPRGEMSERS